MAVYYVDPLFKQVLDNIPDQTSYEVGYSFDIAKVLHEVLLKKGWSQVEFARRLGKKESEISKWLSGTHPFTMKTIAKISAAIDDDFLCLVANHRKKLKRKAHQSNNG